MRVLILLFLSAPAHAGYFTQHVKESIVINQERKPVYREMTAGKSDRIFRRLISLEKSMIIPASLYDLRAQYFRNRGVQVGRDEFVSMDRTPDFDPDVRKIPEAKFSEIPWLKYRNELKNLIAMKDREMLMTRTLEMIKEMSAQPEYWCLTRHLVESIYRFAWFLPERVSSAREKGVKSPENLIWDMMKFHIPGFSQFAKIDRLSAPLQKEGIPVLCSELPDLLGDLSTPLYNK